MSKKVYVQLNDCGVPVRIFRTRKAAFEFGKEWIAEWDRTKAVEWIRRQVFRRAEGFCEYCGVPVTETHGHMHERQFRGHFGEISIDNSVALCVKCHRWAHKSRNIRFSSGDSISARPMMR